VLLFSIQSWCWYLSSSSVVVSPGGWVRRWALWTAICPISGSSSSLAYCQPSNFPGFVYWKFTWSSAPFLSSPLFSTAEACQPSTFPSFVYWKSARKSAICPSPLLQCTQSTLPSLLCVLFSSLFIIQGFFVWFFCRAVVILSRGLCWFIPGVGTLCATYLLTCWSASPKQVWSQCLVAQEPSCFLSVKWLGEIQDGDWDTAADLLSSVNQGLCWGAGDTLGWGKTQGRAETSALWTPSSWKASPHHNIVKE
jgi:hypothetical protein